MILNYKKPLTYFLTETHFSSEHSVLVITLIGELTKENDYVLQECQQQVGQASAHWAILNFRDIVGKHDLECILALDQLFSIIRMKPCSVRFSGIHPRLKEVFLQKKLIHLDEVVNNLAEAMDQLEKTRSILQSA